MDRTILYNDLDFHPTYPPNLPLDVWQKYLEGTRAFDDLWGKGIRCPQSSPQGRCMCDPPWTQRICLIWHRIQEIECEIKLATGWLGVTYLIK